MSSFNPVESLTAPPISYTTLNTSISRTMNQAQDYDSYRKPITSTLFSSVRSRMPLGVLAPGM